MAGLVVSDKATKIAAYHRQTLAGLRKILRAAGLEHPSELTPALFERNVALDRVVRLDVLYGIETPATVE